jgi:hypothetical protein
MMADPNGEFAWFIPLIFAGVNLAADAIRGNIHDWGDVGKSLLQGTIQGTFFALTGGASLVGSGAAWSSLSNAVSSQLPGVSIPLGDRASLNLSPFFAFSPSGLKMSTNLSASFAVNENFNLNVGASFRRTERLFSYGASWHNDGWGLSYSRNQWKSAEIEDQVTGTWTVRHKEWSFSLENDAQFFGDGYDGGRTAAASIGYGDFMLGMNMLTTYGYDKRESRESDSMFGKHVPKHGKKVKGIDQGTWQNAHIYNSNLFLGFRNGNIGYRLGVDAPWVQDAFQNFVHRYVTKSTPYFLPRERPTTLYSYFGLFTNSTHY